MSLYCLNPACPSPNNPNTHQYCQGCGQKLAQTTLGYQFRDRYQVLQVLGEGTFGRTYLVEDQNFSKRKRVLKKFIANIQGKALETAQELFKREAEILDTLKHDQIPAIYDHFEEGNSLYLVEEYIEGEDLVAEFDREGYFSQEKIIAILQDLLPVLEYLHQRNLLHRDIKPDNIMRRRYDGKLVLIDFGGVKKVSKTVGTLIYTPGYAAIEQMTGHPQAASDIYSLGATCVRLLTGCLPAENYQTDPIYDSNQATWIWQEFLHHQGRQVDQSLGEILTKMLAHLPQDRYHSATEILQDLNPAALPAIPSENAQPVASVSPISQPNQKVFLLTIWQQQKALILAAATSGLIIIGWLIKLFAYASSPSSFLVWEKMLNYAAFLSIPLFIFCLGKLLLIYAKKYQKQPTSSQPQTSTPTPQPKSLNPQTSNPKPHTPHPTPQPKSPKPATKPKQNCVSSLKSFQFNAITVNKKGEIIQKTPQKSQYFTVDLGQGITLDMVVIRRGKFFMGCPAKESKDSKDQQPRHWVTLSSFCMGKYPITQAQWEIIMGNNPAHFKGKNRPVESVSWYDCLAFCDTLSQRIGIEFTLPSESQWEYACRGIINPSQYRELSGEETYPPFHFGETITSQLANYNSKTTYQQEPLGIYRQQTTDVGNFPPNAFGLYDMHGNVWEWCADTWHDNYHNAPIDGTPWLNGDDQSSPMRGGSWGGFPAYCRSATRNKVKRDNRSYYNGFRVVYNFGKTP